MAAGLQVMDRYLFFHLDSSQVITVKEIHIIYDYYHFYF